MSTNTKLADKARQALACMRNLQKDLGCDVCVVEADEIATALAAHDAEQAQERDPTSDAFKAGMAAMEYAIWEGKEPCPCRKQAAQAVPAGWRIQRNANGSIGLFAPPPKDGESRRTSECFTGRLGNDKEEIVFKLLDHMLAAAPAPEATAAGQELPPLPREMGAYLRGWYEDVPEEGALLFTADQMRDYARAAVSAANSLAQRQPLTKEQIKELIPDGDAWKFEVGFDDATEFARAIERAHGIGATTGKEPTP